MTFMSGKKKTVIGVLAHVDAGKTTLAEAMLFCAGKLKKLGRVDHRDSFLDTHSLERQRGITIFSKQARFELPGSSVILLDTPGHADFSAEMERTLQVLDCAVLVISGTDGVQAHTETLWRLLRRFRIPGFLFVTKRDLPGAEEESLMAELRQRLDESCVDFSADRKIWEEQAALSSEEAMERFLSGEALDDELLRRMIAARELFPCYFGSGLRPKLYLLARRAFQGEYDNATIKKWLRTFCRRFFAQQFKRSCLPDGPKVGSVSLSPRGDWRMPSDASSRLWVSQCDQLPE